MRKFVMIAPLALAMAGCGGEYAGPGATPHLATAPGSPASPASPLREEASRCALALVRDLPLLAPVRYRVDGVDLVVRHQSSSPALPVETPPRERSAFSAELEPMAYARESKLR